MNEPNYEECSESELNNILDHIDHIDHIDHDKWPDRVSKIQNVLVEKYKTDDRIFIEDIEVNKSNSLPVFSPKQVFIGSYRCIV